MPKQSRHALPLTVFLTTIVVSGLMTPSAIRAAEEPEAIVRSDGPAALRPTTASAVAGEPEILATWDGPTVWMAGINWGGETFGGSISKGTNFFVSSVAPGDYVPVEIRFSSNPAEQTLCQTFLRPGYASNGVGTFPGAAWDMSNPGSPRRLNICFAEWDDGAGPNPAPDQLWNPNESSGLGGKREYLFIMDSDYDGTGLTYAGTNIFAGSLDILYAWWPLLIPGHTLLESEPATLTITPYYVRALHGVPGETSALIGWISELPTAVSFKLYWGTTLPATNLLATLSGSASQYEHVGLTTGVPYFYYVEAYDAGDALIGASREIVVIPQVVGNRTSLAGWWNGRSTYGDCWGYTEAGTGNEYALICARNEGVSIVDINVNPPVEVGFIPSITPGTDMKDVKISGHYAICIAENEPVQIVNISNVTAPVTVATIVPDGGEGAHNCFVDGDYLYIVGNHNIGGLEIYNIATPSIPKFVGQFQPEYYHDVDVRNDTLYAAGIFGDGVDIIDVWDKSAPQLIATFNYPGSGAHNVEISADGSRVFIGDEIGSSGNHVRVFDITDLGNITRTADIIVNDPAITHNCYMKDDLLYISYYTEGLQVWDVSNPDVPVPWAYYDTYLPPQFGFSGAWNVYPYFASGKIIVSDMQTGLYVITLTEFPAGGCACDCHGDPQCDAATNVLDVVHAVNTAFKGATPPVEPNPDCPRATTDVDCNGFTNVLDVVRFVNVAFKGGSAGVEFCNPCP